MKLKKNKVTIKIRPFEGAKKIKVLYGLITLYMRTYDVSEAQAVDYMNRAKNELLEEAALNEFIDDFNNN